MSKLSVCSRVATTCVYASPKKYSSTELPPTNTDVPRDANSPRGKSSFYRISAHKAMFASALGVSRFFFSVFELGFAFADISNLHTLCGPKMKYTTKRMFRICCVISNLYTSCQPNQCIEPWADPSPQAKGRKTRSPSSFWPANERWSKPGFHNVMFHVCLREPFHGLSRILRTPQFPFAEHIGQETDLCGAFADGSAT